MNMRKARRVVRLVKEIDHCNLVIKTGKYLLNGKSISDQNIITYKIEKFKSKLKQLKKRLERMK